MSSADWAFPSPTNVTFHDAKRSPVAVARRADGAASYGDRSFYKSIVSRGATKTRLTCRNWAAGQLIEPKLGQVKWVEDSIGHEQIVGGQRADGAWLGNTLLIRVWSCP